MPAEDASAIPSAAAAGCNTQTAKRHENEQAESLLSGEIK